MSRLRQAIPFLGLIALIALFLKLPDTPNILGIINCKTCASDPYLPLVGAGYFAAVIAASMLFPHLPKVFLARGGLTWAILLALVLTYIDYPSLCG